MSLWVCPTHGLHHGPFCCGEPQSFWDGTFASVDGRPKDGDATEIAAPLATSAVPKADAQTPTGDDA